MYSKTILALGSARALFLGAASNTVAAAFAGAIPLIACAALGYVVLGSLSNSEKKLQQKVD